MLVVSMVFTIYAQDMLGEDWAKFTQFFRYEEIAKKITEVIRSNN